jgi:hypothetical protein
MLVYIIHLLKIMPISDGLIQAIDPLTIGLAIGGVKALAGGIQALTAGKKRPEPKYENKVYEDIVQRAEQAEREGLNESSRMQMMQGAQQAAIFGMRAAQDRRVGIANIGDIQAGLNRSYIDIAARDAEIRQRNFQLTQQAKSALARAKDLQFSTEHASWMNAEQRRRANIGAGLQNIMGGIDFAGSMAAMGAFSGKGGLGTGVAPGFGGSTYNPISKFLSGSTPSINYRSSLGITSPSSTYNLSPRSLSLYRGPQAFNSSILRGG